MKTKLLLGFVLTTLCSSLLYGSNSANMPTLSADAILKQILSTPAKLKVVNFWATWCPPCREELPAFAKSEAKASDEIKFFYISGDSDDDAAEAEKFILNTSVQGHKFRLKPINEEAFKKFSSKWSGSLPATFFYDEKGQLLYFTVKSLSEKQLSDLIKKHTAAPSSKPLHPGKAKPKIKNSQGTKK